MIDAAHWLRDRADSFERDRLVLQSMGWTGEMVMFGTLRDELRRCADELDSVAAR